MRNSISKPLGYKYIGKKIDIYVNGIYRHSTNQSQTCKEAKARYIEQFKLKDSEVKAAFAKV